MGFNLQPEPGDMSKNISIVIAVAYVVVPWKLFRWLFPGSCSAFASSSPIIV